MSLNDSLLKICDPLTGYTIDEMGIKSTWDKTENGHSLHLHAGFPTKTLEVSWLPQLFASALHQDSSTNLEIDLSFFVQSHRTQMLGKGLRGVKNTIAIASGKGGVGKSTVTVNLAAALARAGARVGILDADIYGPSIPMMLGPHNPVQVEDNLYLPVMAHGLEAMSIGYLTKPDTALIWRGPMLAKSLIQMLDSTKWGNLDYLFIDLPPGTGDIQLSLVQKIPLTAAVIVTTPQDVATLEAGKAIDMFNRTSIDVLGVVENMASHTCSQCAHVEPIFGEGGAASLCQQRSIPLLGQLPLATVIQAAADSGMPIALSDNALADSYQAVALKLAIALAKKPLNYADKFSSLSSS